MEVAPEYLLLPGVVEHAAEKQPESKLRGCQDHNHQRMIMINSECYHKATKPIVSDRLKCLNNDHIYNPKDDVYNQKSA